MGCSKLLMQPLGLCTGRLSLGSTARLRKWVAATSINRPSQALGYVELGDRRGGVACFSDGHKTTGTVRFLKKRRQAELSIEHSVFKKQVKGPAAFPYFLAECAARNFHNAAREEAPLRSSAAQKQADTVHSRPCTAIKAEPTVRKLRVEKGFTSSEDGPSTSGREGNAPAHTGRMGRGVNGPKLDGVKTPGYTKTPRKSRAQDPSQPRPPSAERSAVYEMLEGRGKAPKKSLGQNFVIDADVIQRVVAASGVGPGDVVLEIGPGTGNLTKALAAAGAAKIIAVEKDGELAGMLASSWESSDQVHVEEADILRWPVEERLRPFLSPGQRAKCVANLPYNITTSALKKLLPLGSLFSSCTLMLQEEAAERLVNAAPGDSEYRAMSFFVNFYAEPRISFRVDKSAFTPQPKCDSAVVVMGMRKPQEWPEVTSAKAFFSLVNVAFGGRRKMLRNSLQASQHDPVAISNALEELGLDVRARPEQLSLTDFLALFRKLEAVRLMRKEVVKN